MIFKHIKSGNLYRFIHISFNVKTQEDDSVYVSLVTGTIHNRPRSEFNKKFEYIRDAQNGIEPKVKS